MSLASKPVEPVLVYDERLDFNNPKYYSVMKGSSNTSYKQWNAISVSSNNITFTATPPSGAASVFDRRVFVKIPVRAIIAMNHVINTRPLAGLGSRFGPRAFPLARALSSIRASINNTDITSNLGDYINGLQMYMSDEAAMSSFSTTATAYDKFEFGINNGANDELKALSENPLAGWGNGAQGDVPEGRTGNVQFKVVYNPNNAAADVPAIVDMVITCPLILSPFLLSNKTNGMGFYNVSSFTLSLNFYPNAVNRMFEMMPREAGNAILNNAAGNRLTFNNFNQGDFAPGGDFAFGSNSQPILLCNYLIPPARLGLGPSSITQYPYFNYVLETTNCEAAAVNATSNNYQLASIPRRVYIWVGNSVGTLSQTICVPDTFRRIKGIKIQFENSQSIFAEADISSLYQISVKNGYIGAYSDFIKGPFYSSRNVNFDADPDVYLSGTVLCFEFGTDIQLQFDNEAPGSVSGKQYNFQVTVDMEPYPVDYRTAYGAVQVPAVLQSQIHCLFAYEGVFNILGAGSASQQINILSEADVINAQQQPGISYADVAAVQGGGAINFSNLKDITRNIADAAKKVNKHLRDNQVISRTAQAVADASQYVPVPYADQIGTVARDVAGISRKLGYGSGGVLLGTGGGYAKKSALAKKLRQ